MSHVTVVQVHEAHLRSYGEELELWRGAKSSTDAEEHTYSHNPTLSLRDSEDTQHAHTRKNQLNSQGIEDTQTDYLSAPGSREINGSKAACSSLELKEVFGEGERQITGLKDGLGEDEQITSSQRVCGDCLMVKARGSKRRARRSRIIDQNVGVTGSAVLMVSDPAQQHSSDASDAESESSLTSSVSSLSDSDSGLSSTIEVGMSPTPHHSTTIAIGDQTNVQDNRVLVHVIPEESGNDAATGISGTSPQEGSIAQTVEREDSDKADGDVLLEWRVIPPSSPVPQQAAVLGMEGDRGSTPTSFSSAYTVTEHENESTSEESEASRHNWSGQDSEDELQGVPGGGGRTPPCPTPSISEDELVCWGPVAEELAGHELSGIITGVHATQLQLTVMEKASALAAVNAGCKSDSDRIMCRLRHSSEGSISSGSSSSSSECGESVVYNYIPCREQREREDEELWVANEAADPGNTLNIHRASPPLLPSPPGWCGSLGHGSARLESTKRGAVWGEQLRLTHGCVVSPACVASLMCTLAPTLAPPAQVGGVSPPRRHYSTRQRVADVQGVNIVDEEPKYKQNWSKRTSVSQPLRENIILQTSTSTNMPTKRFSFLIRSNSVKQDVSSATEKVTTVTPNRQPITPSDQAILDKLATLNIDTPEAILKPRTRCSLFVPPCIRCGEPVYPQERMEPTIRLVYHNSCFKCYQCGVRLTLKTFFRSPLDSKDTRVFCRSHTPSLDPGRVSTSRLDASGPSSKSSRDGTSSAPHNQIKAGSGTTNGTPVLVKDQLNIVKCDTIGLRYF